MDKSEEAGKAGTREKERRGKKERRKKERGKEKTTVILKVFSFFDVSPVIYVMFKCRCV